MLRQNRSLTVRGGEGRVTASAFARDGCQSWFVRSPRRPLSTNLDAHWHKALKACASFGGVIVCGGGGHPEACFGRGAPGPRHKFEQAQTLEGTEYSCMAAPGRLRGAAPQKPGRRMPPELRGPAVPRSRLPNVHPALSILTRSGQDPVTVVEVVVAVVVGSQMRVSIILVSIICTGAS